MRAASEPPTGKGLAVNDGTTSIAGNPFYSERARLECEIQAGRPQGLPGHSPEVAQVRDVPSCVGQGLGAQSSGRLFVSPPSKQSGHGGDEDRLRGKQTEGRVPGFKRMGELGSRDEPSAPMEDSFQRALEVEIVQHLREQNAQLMSELEKLRLAKNGSGSGDGSTPAQSWVEIPSEGLRDGWDSKGIPQTALRYQGMHHLSRALQFYLLRLLFQLLGMTWLLECWISMKVYMRAPRFAWVTGCGNPRVQVLMSLHQVKLELSGWSVRCLL